MSAPPNNDAAPLAGGACVNCRTTSVARTVAQLPTAAPVRRNAPDTSRAAADRIAGATGKLRARVFDLLQALGDNGATDQEIQDALQMPVSTETPRRWELVRAGLVVASGRKRKTRSNCSAIVWVVSQAAWQREAGGA